MSYSAGNNSANFNSCADWNGQDGNVTTVGSNGGPSYYGTFDQSGNVYEWNDLDGTTNSSRGVRGGNWYLTAFLLSSSTRNAHGPSLVDNGYGFRLASSLNPLNLSYFVDVTDAGNVNDTTGYGAVSYNYKIAQYTVTNCEYAAFLNAVAVTDTYSLYHTSMQFGNGGITQNGSNGSYTYTVKTNMGNKPVVFVSWFDAARYCNWLHNGKPSGDQNNSTTEDGAYTLNGATTGNAVAKNVGANYSIPTENEWYKAAYYKGGSQNAGYWTYATQNDNTPTCISADPNNGNGPESSSYVCSYEAPTPTPTTTITNTPTPNPTPYATRTPTTTPTNTITSSPTASPTPTFTSTPTNTPTITSTQTPTASITPTPTPTLAECKLRDIQVAISDDMLYNQISDRRAETIKFIMAGDGCCGESNTIIINVPSRTPTNTPTPTLTPTRTTTPTQTQTPTNTRTPTNTPTNTPSNTMTPTITPSSLGCIQWRIVEVNAAGSGAYPCPSPDSINCGYRWGAIVNGIPQDIPVSYGPNNHTYAGFMQLQFYCYGVWIVKDSWISLRNNPEHVLIY